ncbi:MAG: hypothetical protein QF879_22500, partial [Candidatus Latescibacteria bacterium]|nr:hypothetical protein [Candidatus Latescibacterota bacterium]
IVPPSGCAVWGGDQHGKGLYEAFSDIHEALRLKLRARVGYEMYSGGVTQRWTTCPGKSRSCGRTGLTGTGI